MARAENGNILLKGSLTTTMPRAKGGGMGMLPIRKTIHEQRLKTVAIGRNVLVIVSCARQACAAIAFVLCCGYINAV